MDLRADRLTKRYGRTVTALDAVSFSVSGPASVAVTGPSGSGKSTLLRLLAGRERPTRGRVRVDGRSPRRAGALGFVAQRDDLDPGALALSAAAVDPGGPHLRERTEALLARLGVPTDVAVRELAAGDRRLLTVAGVLATGPRLLLADEPAAELDAAAADRVADLLLGTVGSGTLLVLATHDDALAARCGRRLVLERGRLVDPG
ncbi:ATP-binding cassette domain-containing protein [Nocardioides anomalus]|uniref:ATP-binding cassette domain-containing protein n=1 Tax=Nocardioides anomalus TaxID=2712223 RepID=A0A6G6WFE3_9ACTN|nr:ATP-binding cassette domain-containing protein [Nocardioides anomalus]QIG44061.1 ATP-binding cassette domain-containing protein [Nocardioides anomalus]